MTHAADISPFGVDSFLAHKVQFPSLCVFGSLTIIMLSAGLSSHTAGLSAALIDTSALRLGVSVPISMGRPASHHILSGGDILIAISFSLNVRAKAQRQEAIMSVLCRNAAIAASSMIHFATGDVLKYSQMKHSYGHTHDLNSPGLHSRDDNATASP